MTSSTRDHNTKLRACNVHVPCAASKLNLNVNYDNKTKTSGFKSDGGGGGEPYRADGAISNSQLQSI